MPGVPKIDRETLEAIRAELGDKANSITIQAELKKKVGITLDESTIRGKFIAWGAPLSKTKDDVNLGTQAKPAAAVTAKASPKTFTIKEYQVLEEMKAFIPGAEMFEGYVERGIDNRLAMHYEAGKHPITQGPQGTGKTLSHMYYAHKAKLPCFLFSCHEEMKLHKLYGDKTILNGSIVFKESALVKATHGPCVILFDEVNAVSNANTFDFHALLQNRELFVKDADGGNGKWYKLHPDCKIGFSMNPKSQKYIGGHIKPSNFLGRCTFLTYPQFNEREIKIAIRKMYPDLEDIEILKYSKFFNGVNEVIKQASLPIDISIRQLKNLLDLVNVGMPLREALNDSFIGFLDAVSQPAAKDSMVKLSQAVWEDLMSGKA